MKLKIFCRCSLFPSWSGYGLISTPVEPGWRSMFSDYWELGSSLGRRKKTFDSPECQVTSEGSPTLLLGGDRGPNSEG